MLADCGHIIVVDDDPSLRQMVIKYLEDNNVPAKSASNRTEFNRHFAGSPPSLIILDLRLGQDDGLVLLREIRSHSDVPVIITTGHRPDEIDRIVGLELGADDYIVKPASGNCSPASVPYCGGRKWNGLHERVIRKRRISIRGLATRTAWPKTVRSQCDADRAEQRRVCVVAGLSRSA
ncbi:MAG: two-component response regulator VirG, partial [Bradyrhizobium sp.]|nr:two-component response regulator VirG [Bradyrhizobium sp.]